MKNYQDFLEKKGEVKWPTVAKALAGKQV